MTKFVLKRIVVLVPVVIGISFIIFAIMDLTPGEPARLILGPYASQSDVETFNQAMGIEGNFWERYFEYMKGVISGDFGISYRTQNDVLAELTARIPCTLTLATGAAAIMVLIGIPVGIVSAIKQYSILDYCSMFMALLFTSIPGFWLGIMLMLLFSLQLGLLPATGVESWQSYILPCITLAAAFVASLIRITRSSMLEVIRQDYIKTAYAKGASEKRVVLRHVLRNAMLPVVTVIGINFAIMMGGAIVTESVFALPGVGTLLITSVRMKDIPVVMAVVMFVAIVIGIINLIVDLAYAYIDPRIKTKYSAHKRGK